MPSNMEEHRRLRVRPRSRGTLVVAIVLSLARDTLFPVALPATGLHVLSSLS
jgi:hypothetical protein